MHLFVTNILAKKFSTKFSFVYCIKSVGEDRFDMGVPTNPHSYCFTLFEQSPDSTKCGRMIRVLAATSSPTSLFTATLTSGGKLIENIAQT